MRRFLMSEAPMCGNRDALRLQSASGTTGWVKMCNVFVGHQAQQGQVPRAAPGDGVRLLPRPLPARLRRRLRRWYALNNEYFMMKKSI